MSSWCFYVDESYDNQRFCLSAIGILHRRWRECFNLAKEHRRNLRQDHGVHFKKEIHATDLVAGRGNIGIKPIHKHARARIFHSLLKLIATMPDVMLFNICLESSGRKDPQLDAWDRLLNRLERTMLKSEEDEIHIRKTIMAGLEETLLMPLHSAISGRLSVFAPTGMIFADEGREAEITRVFRKMTVHNPVPSQFGGWGAAKAKNIPVHRIIEDVCFKKSEHSFFIQLADCAAFALLKRESPATPNIAKYQINEFFDECLQPICYKKASKDPLGIVRR